MLKNLYTDITFHSRCCKLDLIDCMFKIDDCECFYRFFSDRNLIYGEISLKHFTSSLCDNQTLSYFVCKKDLYEFENMIERMKIISKNSVIVGNKLRSKKYYEKSKKYCELFDIELDKCWICYEEALNVEHLKCGHVIHTKCAEKYFKINNHFKCGICKEKNDDMFFDGPDYETIDEIGEFREFRENQGMEELGELGELGEETDDNTSTSSSSSETYIEENSEDSGDEITINENSRYWL